MASPATLPVEVWMHIARELAVPTVDVPWPRDLAALAQVARQVRTVALSLILSRLHFVNPPKGSTFPLAAWVEHVATLLDTGDKTLRSAVRTIIVDSREHQDSMQLRYIDFLVAVQPLARIIRDARRIKRLTLRRVSVTPDIHAALYRLHGLRRLEIEYSYLAPSPGDRPRHKLKELKTLVIRKQPGMAIGDDQEADGFMHLLYAASNLQTLHADDPVLTSLGRLRNFKSSVRSLVLTHQCDLRRLLRCFPDLTSIEFGCMPLSSIDSKLSPKLERFRGPVPSVMPLVPGRPVHSVDISSVCDSDQIACVVQALRRATVPTKAFRFPLTTRGNVEYRMRMLACVADLSDLEQLAVDSDVGVQTTENFARAFTTTLSRSFPQLTRLDVVGVDNGALTLRQHQDLAVSLSSSTSAVAAHSGSGSGSSTPSTHTSLLAAHHDPRFVTHWRALLASNPPAPAPWEEELAREWGKHCPLLRSVSWGVWKWLRSGEEWIPQVRELELRLSH